MSSYSSAALELEAAHAAGALSNPGQDPSSGSTAATRTGSRTAASSSSPGPSFSSRRDASPGLNSATQKGSSHREIAAAATRSPTGGSFASPFEAEAQRRKTASEPNSPLSSANEGSPRAADRARRALPMTPLAPPAVRQLSSFRESAPMLIAFSRYISLLVTLSRSGS